LFTDECPHDEALLCFLSDFRSARRGDIGLAVATEAVDQQPSSSVSTIRRPRPGRFGERSSDDGDFIRLTGARPEGAPWGLPTLDYSDDSDQVQAAELPPPPPEPELVVVSRESAPAWYEVDQVITARRHGVLVRVLAVVLVLGLAAGGSFYYLHKQPVRPIETQPLTSIVKTTVAAARHAGSAHIVGTITKPGLTVHESIDMSPKGGTEEVSMGRDRAQVVVADGYAYVRATYGALTRLMGFPASAAARYQNRWLKTSVSSQSNFGFTGSGIITQVLSLQNPKPYGGKLVTGGNLLIQGTLPSSGVRANLYVSRTSPFYPERIAFADFFQGSVVLDFSNWGEHVKVTPPANALPIGVH
jgi:hypothetical protein